MPRSSAIPLFLLGLVVAAYWYRVIRMAAKARRRTGRAAHLVPPEALGRALRVLWAPAVVVWVVHPMLSAWLGRPPRLIRPIWRPGGVAHGLIAWSALAMATGCFAATTICWKRMGTSWRMGIDPGENTPLIASGPFGYVRHPIYALSALMMLATAAAVPSPLMLLAAAVHLSLLYWESSREERHLLLVHGPAYQRYRARVGRFLPVSARAYRPAD